MERFWKKVNFDGRAHPTLGCCWEWTASTYHTGYGKFRIGDSESAAHRVAWMLVFGEIPEGKMVLHKCDNRKCIRPSHLFLGNALINLHDAIAKGRWVPHNSLKTHCKRGHDLATSYINNGKRHCRTCQQDNRQRYRERHAA